MLTAGSYLSMKTSARRYKTLGNQFITRKCSNCMCQCKTNAMSFFVQTRRICAAEDARLPPEYGEKVPKPKRSYNFDQVFTSWFTVSWEGVGQFHLCLLRLILDAVKNMKTLMIHENDVFKNIIYGTIEIYNFGGDCTKSLSFRLSCVIRYVNTVHYPQVDYLFALVVCHCKQLKRSKLAQNPIQTIALCINKTWIQTGKALSLWETSHSLLNLYNSHKTKIGIFVTGS